jgi:hypothetical protein
LDPGTNPGEWTVTDVPADGSAPDPAAVEEAPPIPAGVQDPVERRRRALKKSAADMLRSLAVVAAIVAVIVLAVPRPTSVPWATADVDSAAKGAVATLQWEPAVPQNLPPGWKARNVYISRSADGILTWHIGYLTADGHYASIEQAAEVTARWEEILTSGGTPKQPQTIDGTTWEQKFKDVRDVCSLIHRGPSRTTLVTSKGGGLQNAEVLARSIPVQLR